MTNDVTHKNKNLRLIGTEFIPCAEDGRLFVARWDVVHTNSNTTAYYIFGIDVAEMATYQNVNNEQTLSELCQHAIVDHIEENNFKDKTFRFEFDENGFELCERPPKWANYDCGYVKN